MSFYAKINSNNIVENVIVCEDSNIGLFDGYYVKVTSSTNQPYIGAEFKKEVEKFVEQKPPYASWILDEITCKWNPPVPYPNDNGMYTWNEESTEWIQSSSPEE